MTFTDPVTGKKREFNRAAKTKRDAGDIRDRLLREFDASDGWALVHETKTFADLVDYYAEYYACPPVWVDGRKVAGMRSWQNARGQLRVIGEHFGSRTLKAIGYEDLRQYKANRLKTPLVWASRKIDRLKEASQNALAAKDRKKAKELDREIEELSGKRLKISSVQRELALLHKMLQVAVRQRWIQANPFGHGESLISRADEVQRQRIVSPQEEALLLKACDHPDRQHLRPILIAALDTGMRQGEILKLRWQDINFNADIISIQAMNTKVLKAREVALTPRLAGELSRLRVEAGSPARGDSVFGVKDNVKRSFDSVRKSAGLPDLRFHDLRHTTATRLAAGHLSLSEIGRVLGHSQPQTTYRYVNANTETLSRAAGVLAGYAEQQDPEGSSTHVSVN